MPAQRNSSQIDGISSLHRSLLFIYIWRNSTRSVTKARKRFARALKVYKSKEPTKERSRWVFYAQKHHTGAGCKLKHIIRMERSAADFWVNSVSSRNLTFPVSGAHSKFPSSAALSTEPVISAQLIRGRGVSWPSLHVTMYYTAALVIVFAQLYSPSVAVLFFFFFQDLSRFVIFVFLFAPPSDLSLFSVKHIRE